MLNLTEPRTDDDQMKVSDEQLDKVVKTLLDIENMDDRPLYHKIKGKIAARRAARRRKMLVGVSAAAAIVAVTCILVWPDSDSGFTQPIAEAEGVRLIVSDGRNFNLSEDSAFEEVLTDGNGVIKAEEGTLFVEASAHLGAEPAYNVLEVPKGKQYDLVLSDGTKVWLNSDTRLRFPTTFTSNQRKVTMQGEAYFEVAADAANPFIVEMGDVSVTVLGTSFNVSAYEYNPTILTTLFTGSVKLNKDGDHEEVVIFPGQQAAMDKATGDVSVNEVNLTDALAWRINIINLEKRTLEEITNYMAKLYNVDFQFIDERARHIRFRGNVTRSEDLFSVLERIGEVGDVRFNDNGNEIEIYMK